MAPVLEIRELTFSWPGATEPVLEELSLSVGEGEFVILRGPSGSGKSTILRLCCRLEAFSTGTIRYRGRDITAMPPAALRSAVRYVPQIPQMVDGTIEENLLLPYTFAQNAGKAKPDKADMQRMLEEFYLGGVSLTQSAMKLSIGQKQRLALMRAILQDPDLLLLDEPTSALDPESAQMVGSIMEGLSLKRHKTLMLVTHADFQATRTNPATYTLENRRLKGPA